MAVLFGACARRVLASRTRTLDQRARPGRHTRQAYVTVRHRPESLRLSRGRSRACKSARRRSRTRTQGLLRAAGCCHEVTFDCICAHRESAAGPRVHSEGELSSAAFAPLAAGREAKGSLLKARSARPRAWRGPSRVRPSLACRGLHRVRRAHDGVRGRDPRPSTTFAASRARATPPAVAA
jgi:hypothetical protein